MARMMNADLVEMLELHGWTVTPGLFSWSATSPHMFERPTPAEFRREYPFPSYVHVRRLHWDAFDTNGVAQFKNVRYQSFAPWDEEMIMPVTRAALVKLIEDKGRRTLRFFEVREFCRVQYVRIPAGDVRVGDRVVAMLPGADLGDGVTDLDLVATVEVTEVRTDANGALCFQWDYQAAPEWVTYADHMSAETWAHTLPIVPRAEHLSAAVVPVRHLESGHLVSTREGKVPGVTCGRPVDDVRAEGDDHSVTRSLAHTTCRTCYRNRSYSAVLAAPLA